jgi:hypothetical protein
VDRGREVEGLQAAAAAVAVGELALHFLQQALLRADRLADDELARVFRASAGSSRRPALRRRRCDRRCR